MGYEEVGFSRDWAVIVVMSINGGYGCDDRLDSRVFVYIVPIEIFIMQVLRVSYIPVKDPSESGTIDDLQNNNFRSNCVTPYSVYHTPKTSPPKGDQSSQSQETNSKWFEYPSQAYPQHPQT